MHQHQCDIESGSRFAFSVSVFVINTKVNMAWPSPHRHPKLFHLFNNVAVISINEIQAAMASTARSIRGE
jgi:hypothetical protein